MSIASYNCGPGNINKAIKRAGGGKKTYWQILPYLPKETQNYVPKFIAMAYVLNFTEHAYNVKHNNSSAILVPTKIDTTLHLSKVCTYLGHSHEEIIHANRELLTQNTGVATNNTVLMPYVASMSFVENLDSATEFAIAGSPYNYYSNYRTSSRHIRHARTERKASKLSTAGLNQLTVRRGQTLHSIAKANGLTVAELKAMNNLTSTKLAVGTKIKLSKHKKHKSRGRHKRNYR
jgi:membrane-bound lytic murein transglycosylase D